jgi:hypothetical protein
MYEASFEAAVLRPSGITRSANLAGRRIGFGLARGPAKDDYAW